MVESKNCSFVTVYFKSGVNIDDAKAELEKLKLTHQVSRWGKDGSKIMVVEVPDGDQLIWEERLQNLDIVEMAHRSGVRSPRGGRFTSPVVRPGDRLKRKK